MALACALMLTTSSVFASDAPAAPSTVVLDRVIAEVSGDPILLSELKVRARPFIDRLHSKVRGTAALAGEREIYQTLFERLIDERLIARKAKHLRLSATVDDVDIALPRIATLTEGTVEQLFEEVRVTAGLHVQVPSIHQALLRSSNASGDIARSMTFGPSCAASQRRWSWCLSSLPCRDLGSCSWPALRTLTTGCAATLVAARAIPPWSRLACWQNSRCHCGAT